MSGPARSGARLAALAIAFGLLALALGSLPAAVRAAPAHPATADFVNLTATSSLSFVPDTFTVSPGASVVLRITQEANFEHTFTLSSVANATLPASDTPAELAAYFLAHIPLVNNVTLGSTPGQVTWVNFTAPAVGSYEFLCQAPTHFQSGMHGTMVSSASGAASSAGLPTFELIGIVVVVVLVVVLVAVVMMRGRRRRSGPTPPA